MHAPMTLMILLKRRILCTGAEFDPKERAHMPATGGSEREADNYYLSGRVLWPRPASNREIRLINSAGTCNFLQLINRMSTISSARPNRHQHHRGGRSVIVLQRKRRHCVQMWGTSGGRAKNVLLCLWWCIKLPHVCVCVRCRTKSATKRIK